MVSKEYRNMTPIEPITGHYVVVNGARTYFDEVGTGTPVVCVHPGATDSRIYRHFLPLLADHGYRVLAPDLPGHCRSYPANWTPSSTIHGHAEFVHDFVKAVLPNQRPFVIGASVGGVTVLDLAANHSESYQALVAMQAASWTPVTDDAAALLKGPAELQFAGWTAHIEEAALTSASKLLTEEQKVELRWLQRSVPQTSGALDGQAWSSHDIRGQLGNVRCPVLLVQGTDDFFVLDDLVDQTLVEIGSSAELLRLPDIGHYPPFENPKLIAQIVHDFFQRHMSASTQP